MDTLKESAFSSVSDGVWKWGFGVCGGVGCAPEGSLGGGVRVLESFRNIKTTSVLLDVRMERGTGSVFHPGIASGAGGTLGILSFIDSAAVTL